MIQYFRPNGELIPNRQELVFWNDQTHERDAYGQAIATACKTPEAGDVFSSRYLHAMAQTLYTQLVDLKQQRVKELSQPETIENVSVTSERLNSTTN